MTHTFGVEIETQGPRSVVIRPGNHTVCEEFPGVPEDGVSATFSRAEALAREDLQFLTWEHPTVVGAMDLVLSGEFGRVSLCTLKLPGVSPGRVFVEAIFLLPWAVVFRELGALAYVEGLVFIGILIVALAYVWRKGDLAWVRSEDRT